MTFKGIFFLVFVSKIIVVDSKVSIYLKVDSDQFYIYIYDFFKQEF